MKCVNKIQREVTHISVHCHLYDLLLYALITGLVSALNERQEQSAMMLEMCNYVPQNFSPHLSSNMSLYN